MQWYDPLNKFMLLKHCDWPSSLSPNGGGVNPGVPHDPSKNSVFELVITPELEYPIICVGVRKNYQGGLKLDLINTNSSEYSHLVIGVLQEKLIFENIKRFKLV